MVKALDLSGKVYGRLTVLSIVSTVPRRSWVCACECGVSKVVAQKELVRGDTKSCGCLRKELRARLNVTHNAYGTYTHKKWKSMRIRVNSKTTKNKCYVNCTIDPAWDSYASFLLDMGEAPLGYSLDRVDNEKGYCKSNCRWVPLFDQGSNKSNNRRTTYNGVDDTISNHARANGLKPDVVFDRINKLGWDTPRALTTATRRKELLDGV